jgi:hypothetical protein
MKTLSRAVMMGWIVASCQAVATPAQGQQRIASPDGSMSVILPQGFEPMQLNAVAELQFADTTSNAFFMAIIESKDDLFGWNLTRHSMVTLGQILSITDFPELSPPTYFEVDGYPSVQYELRGVSQGTQIIYLHTTIDGPTRFFQIPVWSVRSKWDVNQSALREILESIQIAEPGANEPTQPFDIFGLVPGTWAWESRDTGCESDTQRFAISDDRTRMTITHSEPFAGSDGAMRSVTDYVIEGSTPTTLHTFIVDESRVTEKGEPVKWDLVALAPDRLSWHRTDWQEGGLTGALMRCGPA